MLSKVKKIKIRNNQCKNKILNQVWFLEYLLGCFGIFYHVHDIWGIKHFSQTMPVVQIYCQITLRSICAQKLQMKKHLLEKPWLHPIQTGIWIRHKKTHQLLESCYQIKAFQNHEGGEHRSLVFLMYKPVYSNATFFKIVILCNLSREGSKEGITVY